jgi:hypothetical protein
VGLERDRCLRLTGPGARAAAFCRLEHIVPWVLRGARWEIAERANPADPGPERCSHCGATLTDAGLLLVRHRGDHRVRDGFCSPEHLRAWAAKGGRWG